MIKKFTNKHRTFKFAPDNRFIKIYILTEDLTVLYGTQIKQYVLTVKKLYHQNYLSLQQEENTMYYNECIKTYAVEVIKEITEECSEAYKATELIEQFVNNELTTYEVTNAIYEF